MRKTVPVVIYQGGERKVIGDAVVEESPGCVTVDAHIFSDIAPTIYTSLATVTLKSFEIERSHGTPQT